jgi:diacylglycerol kinase
MKKSNFFKSVYIALIGIAHGVSKERNIKIQIVVGIFIIALSYLLQISRSDFMIIILVVFLVLSFELANTAMEKFIDHIHPGYDAELGKVKDIMAGAVLLIVFSSIIIGLLILFVPFINFIRSFF